MLDRYFDLLWVRLSRSRVYPYPFLIKRRKAALGRAAFLCVEESFG